MSQRGKKSIVPVFRYESDASSKHQKRLQKKDKKVFFAMKVTNSSKALVQVLRILKKNPFVNKTFSMCSVEFVVVKSRERRW